MKRQSKLILALIILFGYTGLLNAQSVSWSNYFNRAISNYQGKDYLQALELAEEALKTIKAESQQDNIYTAKTYRLLGRIYSDQNRYKRANVFLTRALGLYETLAEPDDPDLKACLTELANLYITHGNFTEAQPIMVRLYDMGKNSDDAMTVGKLNETMATLYRVQGNFEESIPHFKRVIEIYGESEEIEHEKVIDLMDDLGGVYLMSDRFDDAIDLYRKIINENTAYYGEKTLMTADSYVKLARAYDHADRFSDAEDQYSTAYKTKLDILGFDNDELASLLSEYNGFLTKIGKKIIAFDSNPKFSLGVGMGFFNSFQKDFNHNYHYRPMVGISATYELRDNLYAIALISYHSTDKISHLPYLWDPGKKSLIQFIQNYGIRITKSNLIPVKNSLTWLSSGLTIFDVTYQDRLFGSKMVGVTEAGEFIWADYTINKDIKHKAEGYFIEIGQLFQGTFKKGGNSRGVGISFSLKYDVGNTVDWNFSGLTIRVGGNYIIR
ncbi:tetratricopeptide repeat protein [candidate division KSB1 bacterium]